MARQTRVLQEPYDIVCGMTDHRRAESDLSINPLTGDDMALVFFIATETALRCAAENRFCPFRILPLTRKSNAR